jgi:integrase
MEDLSRKYNADKDREHEKDLIQFRDSLAHLAPKSRNTCLAGVCAYLRSNRIKIDEETKRSDLYAKSRRALTKDIVPTAQEIAKICEFLPIQGKTLVLVLSSSGMRIGESLKIRLDDLDLEKNPAQIEIPGEFTKNGDPRLVFISSEAREALKEWLEYRSAYIVAASARAGREAKDDGRIFPFTPENIGAIWTRASKKAKLFKAQKETKRQLIHIHGLRKYFRTYGKWAQIDVVECLLGHRSELRETYARPSPEIMAEEYLRCEPNLSIYEQSKTVVELKQKVEKQSDDIQQLVVNLSVRNARLENDIAEIKNLHVQHVSELNKMQDWLVHEIQDQFETIAMGYKLQFNPRALEGDEGPQIETQPLLFGKGKWELFTGEPADYKRRVPNGEKE